MIIIIWDNYVKRSDPDLWPSVSEPAQQGVAADELVGRPSAALWRSQLNAGTLGGLVAGPLQVRNAIDIASRITGAPYDPEAASELCDAVEQILAFQLKCESTWPRYEWLDGISATTGMERQGTRVVVRAAVWVSAVRAEPCEIEVNLDEPRTLTLKFMDEDGLSSAPDAGRLKFPSDRIWRYIFILDESSVSE
jgi:hypothetical protein